MTGSSRRNGSAATLGLRLDQSSAEPTWWRSGVARTWSCAPLLLALSSLLWSGNFVVVRAVHGTVSPIDLAFWRWLVAAGVVAGLGHRHLRQDFRELRRHWAILLLLAVVGIAAMNTLYYQGLQSTTALNALLLMSATPLLVLGCGLALYGERPRPRQVIAVVASVLGVAIIAFHGNPAAAGRDFAFAGGDLWIVGGMLCYTLYAALLRRRPMVHAMSFLTATFAIGMILLLPLVIWGHASGEAVLPASGVMLAVIYLALFPSVLAFLCLNRGIELIGAGRAGQYVHLMPVFGSLLAVMFLGERLQFYHGAGAALIAGSLILANQALQPSRTVGSGPGWAKRVWYRWAACSQRAEDRWKLRHAGAQTFRDLGPSRVTHESGKPFWQE